MIEALTKKQYQNLVVFINLVKKLPKQRNLVTLQLVEINRKIRRRLRLACICSACFDKVNLNPASATPPRTVRLFSKHLSKWRSRQLTVAAMK
jgi:hypothetical protein